MQGIQALVTLRQGVENREREGKKDSWFRRAQYDWGSCTTLNYHKWLIDFCPLTTAVTNLVKKGPIWLHSNCFWNSGRNVSTLFLVFMKGNIPGTCTSMLHCLLHFVSFKNKVLIIFLFDSFDRPPKCVVWGTWHVGLSFNDRYFHKHIFSSSRKSFCTVYTSNLRWFHCNRPLLSFCSFNVMTIKLWYKWQLLFGNNILIAFNLSWDKVIFDDVRA